MTQFGRPPVSNFEALQKECTAMETISELSGTELDMVAGGTLGSLVNISVPIAIDVGVGIANQANVAVFRIATQGGTQTINLNSLALAIA
jgi:hypothetical protein